MVVAARGSCCRRCRPPSTCTSRRRCSTSFATGTRSRPRSRTSSSRSPAPTCSSRARLPSISSARTISPSSTSSTGAAYPGDVVRAADARDGPLRRDPAATAASPASPACTSTRRPGAWRRSATSRRCRSFAGEGSRGLRARRSACCCSRTGSRRSRSTSGRTTTPRSPPTRGSGSRWRRRTGRRACVVAAIPSLARLRPAQRWPKWWARGSAAPTSSSATRRASAPRVSIEETRMFRFSPTRS